MSDGTLFRRVEVEGHIVDCLVRGTRVAELGMSVSIRGVAEVVDGRGGALIPGLADHHLHLLAMAAMAGSITVGPPAVGDEAAFATVLRDAATNLPTSSWVRCVGYDERVAGRLDRHGLDRLVADRPVRVQDRSGALWVLNSAALHHLRLDDVAHPGLERDAQGALTGRLWRADELLRSGPAPGGHLDLTRLGSDLAALGITHVTDASPALPDEALELLVAASDDGSLPQHIQLLGAPLGPPQDAPRVTLGPAKLVLSDHALPSFDAHADAVESVHRARRAVAVHSVTLESLVLAISVFAAVGVVAGDRVEHAAVADEWCARELARLGVRVVTQPGFLIDRGDRYRAEVDARDRQHLWRYGTLLAQGIRTVVSSDAPYGPADPWQIMVAARDRRTASGLVVGAAERVGPGVALRGLLSRLDDPGGVPRRVKVGASADLCLLHCPLADALARPDRHWVRRTVCGGMTAYECPES